MGKALIINVALPNHLCGDDDQSTILARRSAANPIPKG
jgi:hypothetical protein